MTTSDEFLPGEPSPLSSYDAFKRNHPWVKLMLIAAARLVRDRLGFECDIHTAYCVATEAFGLKCSRTWLPAYAREIEAETELRFSTRTSQFDGGESPALPGLA